MSESNLVHQPVPETFRRDPGAIMNQQRPSGDPWAPGGRASLAPIFKHDLSKVLFAPTPDEPIVEHANYYATNNRWPVLVINPDTKISYKSAAHSNGERWGQTLDPDEIRSDFERWPNANVGIATGSVSGIFVVETDTAAGHGEGVDGAAALAKLEAQHGLLPPTLEAESPSGSIHRYYKYPAFKIKNSASLIGPGIDVRGDGGMVVAPPSVKPGKGVYVWRNKLPVADAPQWLLDLVKPAPDPEVTKSITQMAMATIIPRDGFDDIVDEARRGGSGSSYIEAALQGEFDEVARAPEGKRNHQLNVSSMKLGHYVGGGELDEKKVIDAMMEACASNGSLKEDGRPACLATISSGLEAGKRNPKRVPERNSVPDQAPDNVIPINGAITLKTAPIGMPLTYFDEVENSGKKNWLMKGVIARNETSMWIAPPGRLKSALMTDMAIHLASGMDWRGYQSKAACGVVYFALERADLVKRRLAAHRKRDELAGLPIAVAGGIVNLMDPKCVDLIVATIREAEKKFGCSVGFAVFDTFAKGIAAGGGDENHAKDLGVALANLRRAQEQTGVHIAVVSHTGKDEKRGARGSNSQDGDVDVLVQISGDSAIKIATVTKANDQAEGILTRFKAEIAVLGVDEDGAEITTAIISMDPFGSAEGQLSKKVPLNPTERRAMDLLYNAINDAGVRPPSSLEFPQKQKVVRIDTWRTLCERGGLSEGAKNANAFRMAFKRVTVSLANKHRIGNLDGWVWVAYDEA
jgi:Bifunctional DNA primase/polymerase, N-terminal/AAA domain